MASSEIRISVDEQAVARAAAMLREAGKQLGEITAMLPALAVEPWIVGTPNGKLAGYVDEMNQEHWIHVDREAPARYRKLYVQKRAPEHLFGLDAGAESQHGDDCWWPLELCIGHQP